jgi:circadian clock protein KaiC
VPGLDSLLGGGFVSERMYLVLGQPGTGKSILGSTFLAEGTAQGERPLYIHGEESREEILQNASTLGIDLDDVEFLDLGPDSAFFSEDRTYELVDPKDVADERLIEDIREAVEALDPSRVLVDPISQLRYFEPTDHQYRRRIVSFMRFLRERGTTVLATETTGTQDTTALQSLSDGVLELQRGDDGRRIAVSKHRGVEAPSGTHGLEIRSDGLEVFPAIVPESGDREFDPELLSTGVPNLDELLGGGLERGTVTILSGPTGIGKSTTAAEFLGTVTADGVPGAIYLFEEDVATFAHRSETFGVPVTDLRTDGALTVREIEPLTRSPEEFAQTVKRHVEERGVEVVVIDGVSGYKQALHGNRADTTRKLHALTRYLKSVNVSVVLVDELSQVTGLREATGEGISYLADNLVFMNYVEREGRIERVVGVLKKRLGDFEETLRGFDITGDGIQVAGPVEDVHGILDGAPSVGGDA